MKDFLWGLLRFFIIILIVLVLFLFGIPIAEDVYLAKTKVPATPESASWMSKIDGHLKLSEITIPGTHDSATTYVDLPVFANTQYQSIRGQLDSGYRYLDIRLGIETSRKTGEKRMKLMHGFTNCRTNFFPLSKKLYLDDVLQQCYSFLNDNPAETIIFAVKQEHGSETVTEFETLLNTYISANPDKWLLTDEIPLLMDARGKLVLCRRYGDDAGLGKNAGIPLKWMGQPLDIDKNKNYEYYTNEGKGLYVQDRYEYGNTEKWEAFYQGFTNPAEKGEVFINFLSTKGTMKYGHPFLYANTLNKKLLNEPYDAGTNYGWIIVDFGDKTLAEKIYLMNER